MRKGLTIAAALTLVPTAAFAHPGIGEMHGFTHGFVHPLGGFDHMLAMVTVGIFAWQLGGRALWLVPAAFVAAMALGGALAMTGVPVPMVETGIAASVIVLGATVALGIKAPVAIAMGLVGLFAIFHGESSDREKPNDLCAGFSRDVDRVMRCSHNAGASKPANAAKHGVSCSIRAVPGVSHSPMSEALRIPAPPKSSIWRTADSS